MNDEKDRYSAPLMVELGDIKELTRGTFGLVLEDTGCQRKS